MPWLLLFYIYFVLCNVCCKRSPVLKIKAIVFKFDRTLKVFARSGVNWSKDTPTGPRKLRTSLFLKRNNKLFFSLISQTICRKICKNLNAYSTGRCCSICTKSENLIAPTQYYSVLKFNCFFNNFITRRNKLQ